MSKTIPTSYDVAEHLRTADERVAYVEACLEEAPSDAVFIAKALGDLARARGMSEVARVTGLSRESLYKVSGDRNLTLDAVFKVLDAPRLAKIVTSHVTIYGNVSV